MDIALAQLALVFLPGIIWARLDATYGSGPKINSTTLAINSFLFGLTAYVAVYAVYKMLSLEFSTEIVSSDGEIALSDFVDEIFISLPVAFFLSIVWLYSARFRWIMRVLNFIGATRRFGLEDVWSFTFNSSQKHVEYVDVRDVESGRVFSGYVNAYSETEEFRELLLVDAIVYDSDGIVVTEAPHLYISFPKSKSWVEFPYRGE
jgi:hypothetical protein